MKNTVQNVHHSVPHRLDRTARPFSRALLGLCLGLGLGLCLEKLRALLPLLLLVPILAFGQSSEFFEKAGSRVWGKSLEFRPDSIDLGTAFARQKSIGSRDFVCRSGLSLGAGGFLWLIDIDLYHYLKMSAVFVYTGSASNVPFAGSVLAEFLAATLIVKLLKYAEPAPRKVDTTPSTFTSERLPHT